MFGEIGIQINYRPAAGTIGNEQGWKVANGRWRCIVVGRSLRCPSPVQPAWPRSPIRHPNWHRKGAEDRQLQPFEQELVDIVTEFRLEPDSAKRVELMAEYNRIFTENIYNIGVVIGRYGLALARRFENVPVGSPVFLYQWTWGNVQPDQVWVNPENQLPEIYPGTVPVYGE